MEILQGMKADLTISSSNVKGKVAELEGLEKELDVQEAKTKEMSMVENPVSR